MGSSPVPLSASLSQFCKENQQKALYSFDRFSFLQVELPKQAWHRSEDMVMANCSGYILGLGAVASTQLLTFVQMLLFIEMLAEL